jgi:hypothetical protein
MLFCRAHPRVCNWWLWIWFKKIRAAIEHGGVDGRHGVAGFGIMKRIGRLLALLLVLSIVVLVVYELWPKYGICLKTTRYDEIACVARRNLHFSAHFTWSFNRYTVDAVMAEVSREDIPVLVKMLGDERPVLRTLAGNILTNLGEDGLASLKRAAESQDRIIRRTAESALMDYEITGPTAQPQE